MKLQSHLAVFRADADPRIGGGHIMRCLAIAAGLTRRGWQCAFATKVGTSVTTPILAESGYRVILVEGVPARDATAIAETYNRAADLLVIDHPHYNAAEERAFRSAARSRMAIDGLFREHDTEILLDPNPEHDSGRLRTLVGPSTRILTGTEYIPINPKIVEHRKASIAWRAKNGHSLSRVLISFGAGDPGPVVAKVLKGIADYDRSLPITVLAATAADLANSLVAEYALNADVLAWQNDIGLLLQRASIVIGACGTGAWERCCLGVPSLSVTIADNQAANARFLAASGAALDCGTSESLAPSTIAETLRKLNPALLAGISQSAAGLVDGHGTERIADAVTRILASEDPT